MASARNKKQCPDCCIWTIAIDEKNCLAISEEQQRLQINRIPKGKRTFEKVINKIIAEWKLWKDHQG